MTDEPNADHTGAGAAGSNDASHDGASGNDATEGPMQYASAYHAPVLYKDVIEHLITDPSGCYVDATLGGGGHAAALLDALNSDALVIGIDQDADALDAAHQRLAHDVERGRFRTVRGNFGYLSSLLEAEGVLPINGLLLDLGVSSHQIDVPERGFSFMADGPLDMRMDASQGASAEEIVNQWDERDLRDICYRYGEERRAPAIARRIVEARPVATTAELADAVRSAVPDRDEVKTLARVFQALRIAVNDELGVLERVLEQSDDLVRTGGRLVVISYHSLEDRRVKRYLRYGNFEGTPVRDLYGNLVAPWEELSRNVIEASDEEIDANPRARSARLRAAERRSDDEAGPPAPAL